jgi:hypothetical protein
MFSINIFLKNNSISLFPCFFMFSIKFFSP